MGWPEMVVAIVLIAAIGKFSRSRRCSNNETMAHTDTIETERLRHEIRSLRERIQVLERVITDNHGSSELDREISRLRDTDYV